MGFALKTCRYGCPSHYYAAGGRLRVGDVVPKLRGVLVLPVSLMYQKMTTPSRTTKTQPLIAALEKWRVSTQQAACDTIHRKLTRQIDVPLEGLVNDSFIELLRRKNNPIFINHNTKQYSKFAITKVPVPTGFSSWCAPLLKKPSHDK